MVGEEHRVLERQGSGDVCGRDLADAVPDDGVRGDSPARPEISERDLDGHVGDLGHIGLVHPGISLVPLELLAQRPACEGLEDLVATLERLGEDGLLGGQLAPHGPPLRPHPGEDERERGRPR